MRNVKLFPAQEKSEVIVDVIRRHWFTYLVFVFIVMVMLIPFLLYLIFLLIHFDSLERNFIFYSTLGLSAYLLFIVALGFYGFIDYYLDVYIVTDRRIVDIKQNGFFKRAISELSLRQIQDVNALVNGVFPTLFHYGDVLIQTAGERENFSFISVPHPYEVSKKIIDLHSNYYRNSKISNNKNIQS